MLTLRQMQDTAAGNLRTLALIATNRAYSKALDHMAHAQDAWAEAKLLPKGSEAYQAAVDRMWGHVDTAKDSYRLAEKGELFQVIEVRAVAAVVDARR